MKQAFQTLRRCGVIALTTPLCATGIAVALLTAIPIHAQQVEVPSTSNLPGIEVPAFSTSLPAAASDTVHVAPPTGEKETDRQRVLSALGSVRPGGIVQFAEGRYVLGEMVDVAVPRITLVGHSNGTTLRGCDPAAFEDREAAVAGCNGLNLVGGHQTLRGLTFEYTWLAVLLGGPQCNAEECPPGTLPIGSRAGGYVVEGNTFRETPNGIRLVGQWTEPAVIRDNRFINTYHAVVVRGMTAHILDNRISVPDPGRVPTDHHSGLALMIGGWEEPGMAACDDNVIAGNRIHGHPDAIAIVLFPGGTCRQNVIRDNEIQMSPVRFTSPSPAVFVRSADDSTVAGVPIALLNGPMGKGIIEDNIIEGNRIIGAEGVAIEVLNASRNRIRNNTISGISPRDPFPGNTLFPNVPEWGESNGSGMWISSGSVDNEISGNSFEDVALHDVVLEGKGNFDTLEVDGRRVRVYARGIGSRAQDSPLVVFEGGSTTPIDAWLGVIEALGDGIPFLAYDPPGIGQSEWDGVRPTPERVRERLRRTLARAGADPPYIVIGHSWAGWALRAFEGMYSDDVAGLVLIDPTPSSSGSGFDAAFHEVEASAEDRATFFELMERMLSAAPVPIRDRQVVIDEHRRAGTDPEVPAFPSVPFVVLSAGRYDTTELPGAEELAFDVPAFFNVMRRLQTTGHREWVSGSPAGTLIYADSLPHCIHCVEPELVARAIRQVAVGDHGAAPRSILHEKSVLDTAFVAPPTGEVEVDRANIVAALEAVRPGGTVQFAPGLYLVGELIPIPTPRITLLGHPDGTTLRGCDPEAYEKNERESLALESEDPADWWAILNRCGMLELTGGHLTIRDLTFEYSRLGLLLGCCHVNDVFRPAEGGYLIEGSTFRNSGNGIRAILSSSEPTVIRDNEFVNLFHALSASVSRVHFLNNRVSVPEPERVPATGHPGFAVGISPVPSGPGETNIPGANVCEENVIAGNRIAGHPDGIFITAYRPGSTCRENTIRGNTIDVQRVRFPVPWIYADDWPMANDADSTFVGIPLGLTNLPTASGGTGEGGEGGRVVDNLVECNRIEGAEGLGIEVLRASRNRIVNNTISSITQRDPFPGNTLGSPPEWRGANGAGIWVSPGSNENEIIGNSFSDVASYDVVVEGDSNHVETPAASEAVRDLGTGNRVTTIGEETRC